MLVTYICMFWHLLLSFFDELLLKIKKKLVTIKLHYILLLYPILILEWFNGIMYEVNKTY